MAWTSISSTSLSSLPGKVPSAKPQRRHCGVSISTDSTRSGQVRLHRATMTRRTALMPSRGTRHRRLALLLAAAFAALALAAKHALPKITDLPSPAPPPVQRPVAPRATRPAAIAPRTRPQCSAPAPPPDDALSSISSAPTPTPCALAWTVSPIPRHTASPWLRRRPHSNAEDPVPPWPPTYRKAESVSSTYSRPAADTTDSPNVCRKMPSNCVNRGPS